MMSVYCHVPFNPTITRRACVVCGLRECVSACEWVVMTNNGFQLNALVVLARFSHQSSMCLYICSLRLDALGLTHFSQSTTTMRARDDARNSSIMSTSNASAEMELLRRAASPGASRSNGGVNVLGLYVRAAPRWAHALLSFTRSTHTTTPSRATTTHKLHAL